VDSGVSFKADTYALGESGPANYTAGAWNCGAATMPDAAHVTVPFGGNVTCTINNDDIAPKLHLRKVVVNDNGGTATTANFTLTANGAGSNDLSGTSPVDSGAGLLADTWLLSETTLFGYENKGWVCSGSASVVTQVTVGIGGEKTCTVTNDDLPGTIIIKKVIKPTGAATQFSFDATGTGYGTSRWPAATRTART
jgi:hypothetical protein